MNRRERRRQAKEQQRQQAKQQRRQKAIKPPRQLVIKYESTVSGSHSVNHDVMPMTDYDAALSWAYNSLPFKRGDLVCNRPWSTLFRLHTAAGAVAYLKIVPPVREIEVRVTPLLMRYFPNNIAPVINFDVERGLLLQEDHRGVDSKAHPPHGDQTYRVLATYAGIQARAASIPDLISALPVVEPTQVLENLLVLLRPNSDASTSGTQPATPAEYFLGPVECLHFWDELTQRRNLLRRYLKLANALPTTLNHCDLHPANTAVRPNGDCILLDWSEAAAGPAGLSLARSFDNSCTTIARVLGGGSDTMIGATGAEEPDLAWLSKPVPDLIAQMGNDRFSTLLLDLYIGSLVRNGYGTRDELRRAIPASALAGAMHFLLSWSEFSGYDEETREIVKSWFRTILRDVVALADFIASNDQAFG